MIDRHKFNSIILIKHLLFQRHDNKLKAINVINNKHTNRYKNYVERYLFKNM